jgi:hypothetical protein
VRNVFGTSLGLSENDAALITSEIAALISMPPGMVSLKTLECHQLFHQFRRSLALV